MPIRKLLPLRQDNISTTTSSPTVAVVAGVFLVTLLVVSILTVRISDMVLDSRDRRARPHAGFLFGLARGLIIVVVAFMFFTWLVPDKQQPEWVRAPNPGWCCRDRDNG